ncbi:hypothetical protein CU254_39110 [Amycolatopsis sp. AA4]|uniref:hypothetical protein n=1 Tax=Actinomycetes TaxID=1760 RepID=UPI0001B56BFB|nr:MULTISPECIES: hypothetical protein [Actinomycetes]ATY15734.1 hypothetical protein CU254_39110 [Amycolatopsis sp. AA4]EFL12034.1 predicted protein [Streptomyces sp. AA4]
MIPAQAPAWQAPAQRRASFGTVVGVELRKMTATVADKILVLSAPLLLVMLSLLFLQGGLRDYTLDKQLLPVFLTIRLGAVLMNVVLVKLIAAEWHYRSAQPTLLAQPSRLRYVLAQATIAFGVWLVTSGLNLLMTFTYYRSRLDAYDTQFLLEARPGAMVATILLGGFCMTLFAVTIGWLIPNTAGAITAYVLLSLLFVFLQSGIDYAGWVDPAEPARQLAGIAKHGPVALATSLAVWIGLAGVAIWRAGTREAA